MRMANCLKIGFHVLAMALLVGSAGVAGAEGSHGGQRFFRPHTSTTPTVVVPNRSTVGGSGVLRPGLGPAKLGGPAKPTSGINGTAIRPKH